MTDPELDQIIEGARPQLRQALRAALDGTGPITMFPMPVNIPLPSGQNWSIAGAIITEPYLVLVAALLQGIVAHRNAMEKANQPVQIQTFEIPV